jgi:hypothetical protein
MTTLPLRLKRSLSSVALGTGVIVTVCVWKEDVECVWDAIDAGYKVIVIRSGTEGLEGFKYCFAKRLSA